MQKKIGFIFLALILCLTLGVPAWAGESITPGDKYQNITPYYQYIASIGADFGIENNGYTISTGNLTYFQNYDSVIKLTLQRSTNGSSWSNVKTWSKSFSGSGYHSLEEGWYVAKGYYYRVVNTSEIKNGNTVLETASHTSERIYY